MRSQLQYLFATSALVLVGALSAGCRPTSGSVELRFPNEAARRATVRLLVEAYDVEQELGSVGRRGCADYLGTAASGDTRGGLPERAFYECAVGEDGTCAEGWFEDGRPLTISSGETIIYVQGFSRTDGNAVPFLEGCTDRFDTGGSGDGSSEVPVELRVVVPESARLRLVSSNRVVGAPGAVVEEPLRARVEADDPASSAQSYPIPGVGIRVSQTGGAGVVGVSEEVVVATDPNGEISLPIRVPSEVGTGTLELLSEAVRDQGIASQATAQVVATAVGAPTFTVTSAQIASGTPVAIDLSSTDGGATPSLAVLLCEGEAGSCVPEFSGTPGRAGLAVVDELLGAPRVRTVGAQLGIYPRDVAIAPLKSSGGRAQISVLLARGAHCQDRVCTDPLTCPCWTQQSGTPCPCEGSEVAIVEDDGNTPVLVQRLTLTASNAEALAPYAISGTEPLRLAAASKGRSANERPCASNGTCLGITDPVACLETPQSCGCPPAETCNNHVCEARDRVVDMIGLGGGGDLINHLGCRLQVSECANGTGSCSCLDGALTGGSCSASDRCTCPVPFRVLIGSKSATSEPFDIAAGRFHVTTGDDLVVASGGGLEPFDRTDDAFAWQNRELINAPIHLVKAGQFDPKADAETGVLLDDVLFLAREKCLVGISYDERCPRVRVSETAKGCLGVLDSAGAPRLLEDVQPSRCRRFDLDAVPIEACVADIDGDGNLDAAVTVEEAASFQLYLGDGWGGLSFPPTEVELPPGMMPGPVACEDIDGDGAAEVVVVGVDGNIAVFRRRAGS